jgi:hypothetical protein
MCVETQPKEIVMNVKQLIAIAAIAAAPFAANADQGDKYFEQLFGMPRSTLSVAEVRAQDTLIPYLGERHLVDLQVAQTSTLSRAEVVRELLAARIEHAGA